MTPERWRQLEELYQAARDLPASQQSALLRRADPELRAAVALILAQEGTAQGGGTFIERPAWEGLESLLKTETFVTVGEQLGPYQIEQKICQGGMGEVFRATDTRLYRTFRRTAIQQIRPVTSMKDREPQTRPAPPEFHGHAHRRRAWGDQACITPAYRNPIRDGPTTVSRPVRSISSTLRSRWRTNAITAPRPNVSGRNKTTPACW